MEERELYALMAGHILERQQQLQAGGRLVHYTSAEAAHKILSSRQVWLRNAVLMNDFSEIAHGLACLHQAWASPAGQSLQEMLGRIRPELQREVAELFDAYELSLRTGTFIISVSEHLPEEDLLGRLSMWRAYGGKCGVALVLNLEAFVAETDEIKVFSAPVFYRDVEGFVAWFAGWAGRLLTAEGALREIDPELIKRWLFFMFRTFAMCTKHPAFEEEREWRVFHSPTLEGASDWLRSEIEVVHGVPQLVVKLALRDDVDRGVHGMDPSALLNRVIIGPCAHPSEVRIAMGMAMEAAGVPDPWDGKLWMSLIPLRQ